MGLLLLLLYSLVAFTVCGNFLYYILVFQSFELTMQDSHPSLYSIKTLYHLYIFDPSDSLLRMSTLLVKLFWNTQKSIRTNVPRQDVS